VPVTAKERIIDYLQRFGRTSDAKPAAALRLLHPQVNQACRHLEPQGIVRRDATARPILNELIGTPDGPKSRSRNRYRSGAEAAVTLTEDDVRDAVKRLLESQGYTVTVRWGRDRGIDIEANHEKERLVLEAEGESRQGPQQRNYFTNAIGELVERMTDPPAKYGLALPDNPQFRGLVERLPPYVWDRLQFCVYFVSRANDDLVVLRTDRPSR